MDSGRVDWPSKRDSATTPAPAACMAASMGTSALNRPA